MHPFCPECTFACNGLRGRGRKGKKEREKLCARGSKGMKGTLKLQERKVKSKYKKHPRPSLAYTHFAYVHMCLRSSRCTLHLPPLQREGESPQVNFQLP